jgi:ATP-binding cassette subfamily G (WHITE) protein 2 (SNQ2)
MYSWSAFTTAYLLVEIPWNLFGSLLLFLCWYWTVGFPSDRAGYTYLMLGVAFPLYYSTFALATAAVSPNAEVGNILFSTLFNFIIAL